MADVADKLSMRARMKTCDTKLKCRVAPVSIAWRYRPSARPGAAPRRSAGLIALTAALPSQVGRHAQQNRQTMAMAQDSAALSAP
jgi:hypothetical protein